MFGHVKGSRWFLVTSVLVLVGLAVTGCGGAGASNYPTKPIDLIVPFGPGGAADVAARLVSKYAAEKLGQPVNVVNVAGGSGVVGTQQVINAKPDGYTLLMDNHASSSLMAATQSKLPFDWAKRTWVGRVTVEPLFYAVKADSPHKSLSDVVAAAKANPKAFRWGSCGPSCIGTFGVAQLFDQAGLNIKDTNMVVFKSGGETLVGLAGGNIDLAAQQLSEVAPLVQAGKIRPLAVVWTERLPEFKDVPTVKELNLNLDVTGWQGISGPPGLPDSIVKKWQSILAEAAKDPAFLEQARKVAKVVAYLPGEEMRKFAQGEKAKYQPLVTKLGLGQ